MVLMAALFFTMQGFAQAHALSNGGDDHSHEGVPCEIALLTAEEVVLTPPPPAPKLVILPSRMKTPAPVVKSIPRSFDSRAPPLRGPPQ